MNSMIFKRIQTILALLLVGSVSILAEGDDPFPAIPAKWQGNMTLSGRVYLNGEELGSETVVAAYENEQIRGKSRINENKSLTLTILGNAGEHPAIHFKVYTGGRIIEVDQGLTYTYYAEVGSYADPYIINLPTPVTTNTSSEGWATTCLPYNALVPDGVSVFTGTSLEDKKLMINKVECTILPKNTPVLLKTDGQTTYEWLARVADGDAVIETNIFKGTTEPTAVEEGIVMTLGHASDGAHEIGFWQFTGTEIPANRAYLEVPAANVRGFTLSWSDETTALAPTLFSEEGSGAAYDLQGRKVRREASKRGSLMIVNGKKQIVK